MCVRVCMWMWVCKYRLWVCKYMVVWCEHRGVPVVVWLSVFVCVKVCVWCCDVGVCGWVHTSVCQWYAVELAWVTLDSLCKRWTCPEKGWSLLCCNPVPSTVQAHRNGQHTCSEWTAASPAVQEIGSGLSALAVALVSFQVLSSWTKKGNRRVLFCFSSRC